MGQEKGHRNAVPSSYEHRNVFFLPPFHTGMHRDPVPQPASKPDRLEWIPRFRLHGRQHSCGYSWAIGFVRRLTAGLGVVGRLTAGLGFVGRLTAGLGFVGRLTAGLGVVGRLTAGLGFVGWLTAVLGVVGRVTVGVEVVGRLTVGLEVVGGLTAGPGIADTVLAAGLGAVEGPTASVAVSSSLSAAAGLLLATESSKCTGITAALSPITASKISKYGKSTGWSASSSDFRPALLLSDGLVLLSKGFNFRPLG